MKCGRIKNLIFRSDAYANVYKLWNESEHNITIHRDVIFKIFAQIYCTKQVIHFNKGEYCTEEDRNDQTENEEDEITESSENISEQNIQRNETLGDGDFKLEVVE